MSHQVRCVGLHTVLVTDLGLRHVEQSCCNFDSNRREELSPGQVVQFSLGRGPYDSNPVGILHKMMRRVKAQSRAHYRCR